MTNYHEIYCLGKFDRFKEEIEMPRRRNDFYDSLFSASCFLGPEKVKADPFEIKNVVFNDPLTIVIWEDGTKTFIKRNEQDSYDPEKALAMAIAKKALGNKYKATQTIYDWVEKKDATTKSKNDEPVTTFKFSGDIYEWCQLDNPVDLCSTLVVRRK